MIVGIYRRGPLSFSRSAVVKGDGLYSYRARYCDLQFGRFISEDPIGLAGGINVYAYAMNDPLNLRDPSGLSCEGDPWELAVDQHQWHWPGWAGGSVSTTVIAHPFRVTASRARSPLLRCIYDKIRDLVRATPPRGPTRHMLAALCLMENGEFDVQYGANMGAGVNLGVVDLGVGGDAGTLNFGSSGFALSQGWFANAVLNIPYVGSAGFSCGAERLIEWNGSAETSSFGASGFSRGVDLQSTRSRGRIGVYASLAVGASASLDVKNFGRCLTGR